MRTSITLCNETAQLAQLEGFAGEFAHASGLPDDERARLFIILEELFTNAVAYGYAPGGASGSITVKLGRRRDRLVIDFVDDGQAFDPLALREPDLEAPEEERRLGGLGVHIVRSLVDEAHYRREGGRNHLRLVRRTEALSAAGG